jgi:hypothetical protein
MPTLEHEAIAAALANITSIEELREIRYNVGQFYVLNIAGYKMRVERRKMRASDLRIGFASIGMAGLMTLAFALDQSLVYSFVESAPLFSILTAVGLVAAGFRKIRLSDWFMLFFMFSFVVTAMVLFPVMMMDADQVNSFLAAGVVFSVSLALFLNISTFFYVLKAHFATPSFGPAWHEVGA